MKHPKLKQLKIKRKIRLRGVRKFKKGLGERFDDCWFDIRPYLIKEVMLQMKEQGIIYAKTSKKNKKKNKR